MPYQVIARKYRPQRFDDVVGQRGVTQTLRNALTSGRIAQSFVFAGTRGVGKTTTARILARALNCEKGPTPDPCGVCASCVEIAEGRDIDVLEIDAATNTQVEKVRDVIIEGLAISPIRNRYKIFIIDEVHQLSSSSFNALLKSIEEPPPHVIFMMATTELGKIPDTITSRSQVFEFKTISMAQIAAQLRQIATAEDVKVDDVAIGLIARAAEGSMRDAESALDQVIGFAGKEVTAEDVRTVLGLIGRDLLLDIVETVADENSTAVFGLVARSIEAGQDLRVVCRELTRVVRDLMLLAIDPSRAQDPEIALEGDPARMVALAARFSREDLLRSFDVLARTEEEIRFATQPRYHLEMGLLRWIHLRKLTPLSELIDTISKGGVASAAPKVLPPTAPRVPSAEAAPPRAEPTPVTRPAATPAPKAATPAPAARPPAPAPVSAAGNFKESFLEEIKRARKFFHNAVVAQARRIDVTPTEVTFVFAPAHRALRNQLDQSRQWLEGLAEQVSGRKVKIVSAEGAPEESPAPKPDAPPDEKAALRERAMSDEAVQAMLDVLPAEIKDVEELKK